MTEQRRASNALELRLDAAATPERVAAAANLLARLLRAAAPALPDGSVTMVVENYATRARLRTRSDRAKRAVALVVKVLENPTAAAVRDPRVTDVALAFLEDAQQLEPYRPQFYRPRSKKPLAEMTPSFLQTMRFVAYDFRPRSAVRGTTVVYSRVYRVGATNEGKEIRARIFLGGDRPSDIRVSDGAEDQFWEAARSKRRLPIKLKATWVRAAHGELLLDPRRTVAIGVDLEWRSASGKEVIETATRLLPDAFEDLEEILRAGGDE